MRNPCQTILAGILALGLVGGFAASAQETQPAETRPAETQPAETQPAETQPAETRPASQPASQPTTTAATTTTTTAEAEEEDKEAYLAVINGRVHTVTGPVYERGTVLCKDGVIEAIGTAVPLPDDCQVIDADGMYVYPGLVAVISGGILGGGDPQDSTNVFSLPMVVALAGGITTTVNGTTAGKLTFGTTEGLLLRKDLYHRINYSRRSPLQRAEFRQDLERVRSHLREQERYEREKERDEDAEPPDKDWLKGKYQQYLKLMKGETLAYASASSLQDLLDLADLVRTYGIDLVVHGAYEGWIVPDELGRAGIDVIINARVGGGFGATVDPDPRLMRPSGATIQNAHILHEHGVTAAIIPPTTSIMLWGLAGRDLLHLNMEAAFAVRGGMSNEDAIEAITIDAARVLRLDDRVGSLEVGKDADLIVCDGHLLHYMTHVHYAVVNGRVAYTKQDESLFAHIRPEGKPEVSDFADHWPRPLEWPE